MVGKARFQQINALLGQRLEEKKALVAVHRGAWGGNIIENTIPSFELALSMGADMFECDLSRSTDGVVYAFHDGGEARMFGIEENIRTLSSGQIDSLEYINSIGQPSGVRVQRFEEVLSHFRGGELFNIDRAWDILPETAQIMKRYPHAMRQAVIKTPAKDEYLEFFDQCPEKYMYMPIVYSMDEVRRVLSYPNINVVGMEIIAFTEDADLYQEENVRFIREQGLYVWVNTIVLGTEPRFRLYGRLDDDTALLQHPDKSWGTLYARGVNVEQTDWPLQMSRYRDAYFRDKTTA